MVANEGELGSCQERVGVKGRKRGKRNGGWQAESSRAVEDQSVEDRLGGAMGQTRGLLSNQLAWWQALLLAFILVLTPGVVSAESPRLSSIPDLEAAMYASVEGWPCVRLLTLDGEIGCSNPDRNLVIAPIQRLASPQDPVSGKHAVLLPPSAFGGFMERLERDPRLSEQVAGVLLEADNLFNGSHQLSQFSPAGKYPQAEWVKETEQGYVWNPAGSDIARKRFQLPVYLLNENATRLMRSHADFNQRQGFKHPLYVAEFDLVMYTTLHETANSAECLAAATCLPLGGYSVLSSLPPATPPNTTTPSKPIILALASIDAASSFRDLAPGAESPLSGAIALLAAVDALARVPGVKQGTLFNQLVFAFLTGESWGYLGSRRLLAEVAEGMQSVDGFNWDQVEAVLEVGSVGRARRSGGDLQQSAAQFFAHRGKEQAASVTAPILAALISAADSMPRGTISVHSASPSTPTVPPGSSLTSFLRQNPHTPGLVLVDFDAAFSNPYYQSIFDDVRNIDADAIVSAGTLVARALLDLAWGGETPAEITPQPTANPDLVTALIECLLVPSPGLSCSLVQNVTTPLTGSGFANHYTGILQEGPGDNPFPLDDTSRFLWNLLVNVTGSAVNGSSCEGECPAGQACVGWTAAKKGTCLNATARYVPAYSTRLHWDNGWQLLPLTPGSDLNSDPVYTESFWNQLHLRAYMAESPRYEKWVFVSGLAVTGFAWLLQEGAQRVVENRLKQA